MQAPKFMAINQEVLLVAAGLEGAVLTGQPELIHEPEDFDVWNYPGLLDSCLMGHAAMVTPPISSKSTGLMKPLAEWRRFGL